LSEFGQKKVEEADADQARASRHIDEVISFLEEAENRNWTIAPDATMLEKLANYGYAVTGLQGTAAPRQGTEPATGVFGQVRGVFARRSLCIHHVFVLVRLKYTFTKRTLCDSKQH
jgi:hypothetical protein